MYTGLLPILTARLLQNKLETAIAAIQEPWSPRVNVCSAMPNSSAKGARAEVKRGPIAIRDGQLNIRHTERYLTDGDIGHKGVIDT